MQLMIVILTKTEKMPQIVSNLMNENLGDPTVIDCQGSLKILDDSDVEPPPIFGSLRYIMNRGTKDSKMMFLVLKDGDVEKAKKIVDKVVGGLDKPNTGILFTLPISDWAGLHE